MGRNYRKCKISPSPESEGDKELIDNYLFAIEACAAASLAIGTRNGEHDT